jgi:hypothetical protein
LGAVVQFTFEIDMRLFALVASVMSLSLLAACAGDPTSCCASGQPTLRVINAFTAPVDVLIDGTVVIGALAEATSATASPAAGGHSLILRPVGSSTSVSQAITTTTGALGTIAVVRSSSGALETAVLDDTNSVVPAGATKVRVLHFAPNAGTLQVFRTQPDYQQPIAWQFPFNYQSAPTSLSAPFYQSTAGSWEVRVWQQPADASGWAGAAVKVVLPLTSGEKRTIVILDKPGGGVRIEVL